jgi:hypothetical protein
VIFTILKGVNSHHGIAIVGMFCAAAKGVINGALMPFIYGNSQKLLLSGAE